MKSIQQLPAGFVIDPSGSKGWPFVLHHGLGINEQIVAKICRRWLGDAYCITIEIAHEIRFTLHQLLRAAEIFPHGNGNEGQKHGINGADDGDRGAGYLIVSPPDAMWYCKMRKHQPKH